MNNQTNPNWRPAGYGGNDSSGAPSDAAQAYYLMQQHQAQQQQHLEESKAAGPSEGGNAAAGDSNAFAAASSLGNTGNDFLVSALNNAPPSDPQNLIGMVQANHPHQQQLQLQQQQQFGAFPVSLLTANQNHMGAMMQPHAAFQGMPQQPYTQLGGYGATSAMQPQHQLFNPPTQPTPFQQIQGLLNDPNLDAKVRHVLSNISGQLASEWDASSQNLSQILSQLIAAAGQQQGQARLAPPLAAVAQPQQQQQPTNSVLSAQEKATSDAFLLRLLNMAKSGASDDAFAQIMSAASGNLPLHAAAAPVSTSTVTGGETESSAAGEEASRKRTADDDLLEPPTRKPRKKRDKNMPKGPLSAYNYYFKAECKHIQRGGTGEKGYVHLARTISGRWKDLDAETKAPYFALAAEDRARYDREMDVYRRRFINKPEDVEGALDDGEGVGADGTDVSDEEEEASNDSRRSNSNSSSNSKASTDDSDQDRKPPAVSNETANTEKDYKESDDDGPTGSTEAAT